MASKPYNGHPSWNAWNVALWIGNDEGLYRLAMEMNAKHKRVERAARAMLAYLPERTPDGARYSHNSVKLALAGLKD